MATTYRPTSGMASAAKRALKWKSEGKPGGTLVGLARANQLKDRDPLTASTVLRMFSFFSRHEVDKRATGFNSGEEGFPSKGRVAWDLWGGDGGYSWSTAKRNHIMRERESKALHLVKLTEKGIVPKVDRMVAAQVIENYANQNISEELEAFIQHGMMDLLFYLKYLVDTLRDNNVVWGVGRGSSVASYVLYLIGVHRIDSMKYNLDWHEFLR